MYRLTQRKSPRSAKKLMEMEKKRKAANKPQVAASADKTHVASSESRVLKCFAWLAGFIVLLVLMYVNKDSLDTNGRVYALLRGGSNAVVAVPECPNAPWKPNENLVGTCPDDLKPVPDINNVADCATSCCEKSDCVTWQFRRDKGCLQGGDVRIGLEKDGVRQYCSDHPPLRWNGQRLGKDQDSRAKTCSTSSWNPSEQEGQCFGLGDRRPDEASASAQSCMEACCNDPSCGAWQFHNLLGCFYDKGMHSCQKTDDPMVFQPFVGRRKKMANRKYVDAQGNPAVSRAQLG